MQDVDHIVDRLGMPIDPLIKFDVSAFRTYGFPTDSSCQGHPETSHGENFPWIGVYLPDPDGWRNDVQVQDRWRVGNTIQQDSMRTLLQHADWGLAIEPIGIFGGFNVLPSMTSDQISLSRCCEYRVRFREFSNYLLGIKK